MKKTVIYIYNHSRAHKILPLLEGFNVLVIKRMVDLFQLRKYSVNQAVVLVDSFGMHAIKGIFISTVCHLPLVVRLRGEFFREEEERRSNQRFFGRIKSYCSLLIAKVTLRVSSKVICNSKYLACAMRPYLKQDADVVYNPYTELSVSGNKGNIVLPQKGFHVLTITNMNLKSKVMPIFEVIRQIDMDLCNSLNLYWFVCGKGYYFEQLSQVVKERGLERNIIIHKHTEDVKSLYFWADIMIHLTRMDAFPNCTMEAMMHGVPVITNPDSCGTIELVQDGVNGLIGEDILALIERYKLDGSMIKLHGLNGKQIVETQFSVEAQKNIMKSVLMRW